MKGEEYIWKFDKAVAIEALLYIARRLRRPNIHSIVKVMYFADKYHLEKYGRVIVGDKYIAMEYGPVPSNTYDLVKEVRNKGDKSVVDGAFLVPNKSMVTPLREENRDYLSESDLEALNYSIAENGHLKFDELTEKSHDASWKATQRNRPISINNFVSTLESGKQVLNHVLLEG